MPEREQFSIPVTTWLKPATFLAFERIAEERGTSITVLISRLADLALKPKASQERLVGAAYKDKIRQLHAQGLSDDRIGKITGRTGAAIAYHRKRLGLSANHPFGGKQR